MGSGEMWRLRRVDPDDFDQFYTKLIRHVSQGRLLRGSRRGVLLPGQDRYLLGNTVEIRAQLTNARLQPLTDKTVVLEVIPPDGAVQTVTLAADPSRAGSFTGQFAVLQEGAYRLELPCRKAKTNDSPDASRSKCPNWNGKTPSARTPCCSGIADQTRGTYFDGMPAVLGTGTQAESRWSNSSWTAPIPNRHRRPRSAVGAKLVALADDRALQPVVSGMVDPAIVQTGVSNDEKGRNLRRTVLGPRRAGDARRAAPPHPGLRLGRGARRRRGLAGRGVLGQPGDRLVLRAAGRPSAS